MTAESAAKRLRRLSPRLDASTEAIVINLLYQVQETIMERENRRGLPKGAFCVTVTMPRFTVRKDDKCPL